MTDLKIATKTVHTVDAYDLEAFVQEKFGIDFSFMADQEAGDDSDHKFSVDGDVDKWAQERVDELLAGGYPSFAARDLLNYMARAGMIPTGDYLISLY